VGRLSQQVGTQERNPSKLNRTLGCESKGSKAMARHSVLVVDDEPLIRMIAAEAFRDAEFDVFEAEDASSALEVLGTAAGIELMCTDVQMPGGLDGVELARLVKRLFPDVRVIITSGYSPKDVRLAGVPFLPKPFSASDLVALARAELLRSARALSEPADWGGIHKMLPGCR